MNDDTSHGNNSSQNNKNADAVRHISSYKNNSSSNDNNDCYMVMMPDKMTAV